MDVKISQVEKQSIKHIMGQAGWESLMVLKEKVNDQYRKEEIKAETEFQTLWNTAQREAKVNAIDDFFRMVENYIIS